MSQTPAAASSSAPGAPAGERAARRAAFLAQAGWGGAQIRPLAGDASNRRYDRLSDGPGGAGAVLMDAPPEKGEDLVPFLGVTQALRARGFSAPEILAADPASGFAVIEDLGDALYARVCAADPAQERPLYLAAAELLAELQSEPAPEIAGDHAVPPYDAAALEREAMLLPEWYLAGQGLGSPALAEEFRARVAEAMAPVAGARAALALRDFHAENLLWLPDRRGAARVGLIDYQDALRGHGAYDLISLTEDARRDTSDDLRAATAARYLEASGQDAEAFGTAAALLAAQRNMKIVGIFARLRLRDGKPQYLDLIPRVWGHLMRDLAHPALSDLRGFVSAHVPPPDAGVLARLREGAA
ncbi:phosphotransferase [Albimonas sp. CAU 1670]|uniref:aminoglycoside phosphotransferase family protein n=1 Tax=Albimonas sp. CAU 1670 TaxID=3032599 RepID=UPI0023DBC68A|nr:phosphotransferase [Albimonas sp. CAU 1670]MDF2232495.1 phosphotransferase [Albimonas sp. CAU 1670]